MEIEIADGVSLSVFLCETHTDHGTHEELLGESHSLT